MYFFAAVGAAMNAKKQVSTNRIAWIFIGFFYILFVGYRTSGGDWYNYFREFKKMEYFSLEEALGQLDIGYQLVSYYMYHLEWDFFGLTLICATVSMVGLIIFLRSQPNPWLGLAVAVPYLIIVVYMGYMRQGVALGLVMWGIVLLQRGKFVPFLVLIMFATTFHKSAIMMIAFGIFSGEKGKILKVFGVVTAGAGVWAAFVSSGSDALWTNYVDAKMESQGALIRVILNSVPAVLLFYFRKQWQMYFNDYRFWMMIALASLASIGLVGFASTAVDRMALYFIPLQLVTFSRLPLLAANMVSLKMTTYLVLLLYFSILFVWLNFGANSMFWLPYRNFLWEGLL